MDGIERSIEASPKTAKKEALLSANRAIAASPSSILGQYAKARFYYINKEWDKMYETMDILKGLNVRDIIILSSIGKMLFRGGKCSLEDYRDKTISKSQYTVGNCVWKSGVDLLFEIDKFDKKNVFPSRHFDLSSFYLYQGRQNPGAYDDALNRIELQEMNIASPFS